MTVVRALIRAHPALAALLVTAVLAMKILVPNGFMPVFAGGGVTLQLCPATSDGGRAPGTMSHDTGAAHAMSAHATPQHAMSGPSASDPAPTEHKHDPASKSEMPCVFAGLAAPVLAAVDAVLLAIAIAFVAKLAVQGQERQPPRSPVRLRPPLRAPPLPC